MRAVICNEYGPPESLRVAEISAPGARPGHAIVDVAFAAVNFPDVLMIANRYQVSIPTPFIPGAEFSGVVVAVGEGVTNVAVGDRVFGGGFGAFAEQIQVAAASLKPVPASLGIDLAAGLWVAHATAYHSLRSVADVQPGETVVVLGAAGGVGLAAVELAGILGAQVIAAASSDEKLAVAVQRGATSTVNYAVTDLREALKDVAADGIDVVVDPVGGQLAERALRALRYNGRYVTIGFASGEIPRIPLNLVLLKGCVVKGFDLRTFAGNEPAKAARDEAELLGLLVDGRIRPHISAVYDLDHAAEALNHVASRQATGKVLVHVNSSISVA